MNGPPRVEGARVTSDIMHCHFMDVSLSLPRKGGPSRSLQLSHGPHGQWLSTPWHGIPYSANCCAAGLPRFGKSPCDTTQEMAILDTLHLFHLP
jgi:hypothetical protein